jgi:biopolymer transport protein ExbD
MITTSILGSTSLSGHISRSSVIAPEGGSHKKSILADLLLTALIDAFSILVIFLLMSFSSSGELVYLTPGQELPKSGQAIQLERTSVIRVEEGGKLFLEEKEVTTNELVGALIQLRKDWAELHQGEEFTGALTIQADRRIKFDNLSQVVQASSHAGFSDIKFAVLMK